VKVRGRPDRLRRAWSRTGGRSAGATSARTSAIGTPVIALGTPVIASSLRLHTRTCSIIVRIEAEPPDDHPELIAGSRQLLSLRVHLLDLTAHTDRRC
jgi:hypothetical protein